MPASTFTYHTLHRHTFYFRYNDAKVGIFIHWGVFSVPSYHGEWFWWDWKGSKLPDVVDFMEKNYPPTFQYPDFAAQFTAEFFNASQWADLFKVRFVSLQCIGVARSMYYLYVLLYVTRSVLFGNLPCDKRTHRKRKLATYFHEDMAGEVRTPNSLFSYVFVKAWPTETLWLPTFLQNVKIYFHCAHSNCIRSPLKIRI